MMQTAFTGLRINFSENAELSSVLERAWQKEFGPTQWVDHPKISAAIQASPAKNEFLVALHPGHDETLEGWNAVDSNGLPRWPALFIDPQEIAARGIPRLHAVGLSEALLAQALRNALTLHELRRQIGCLRGDLLTIGNRFCHDLRTPLGGIGSAGELLREVLTDENPGAVGLIQPIFDCSEDLVRLINRVSFLVKATGRPLPATEVAMEEVALAVLERLESLITRKNASVIQPASWPAVRGVAPWLEVIWWNLLSNALQYGGEHPKIELGWDSTPGGHSFWVRDSGPGVPVENRANLFQPFHQLHGTNGRRGLGLSIVQRLVGMQNGQCGHEPGPSGGSRFYFTLPGIQPALNGKFDNQVFRIS